MGNRRHYYRNAAAAASRMQSQTNTQQQQPQSNQQNENMHLNNMTQRTNQPIHTGQPIPNQMNINHGSRDQFELNNNVDMMGLNNNLLNNNPTHPQQAGLPMNGNYMHQGKIPYNMYLF